MHLKIYKLCNSLKFHWNSRFVRKKLQANVRIKTYQILFSQVQGIPGDPSGQRRNCLTWECCPAGVVVPWRWCWSCPAAPSTGHPLPHPPHRSLLPRRFYTQMADLPASQLWSLLQRKYYFLIPVSGCQTFFIPYYCLEFMLCIQWYPCQTNSVSCTHITLGYNGSHCH